MKPNIAHSLHTFLLYPSSTLCLTLSSSHPTAAAAANAAPPPTSPVSRRQRRSFLSSLSHLSISLFFNISFNHSSLNRPPLTKQASLPLLLHQTDFHLHKWPTPLAHATQAASRWAGLSFSHLLSLSIFKQPHDSPLRSPFFSCLHCRTPSLLSCRPPAS